MDYIRHNSQKSTDSARGYDMTSRSVQVPTLRTAYVDKPFGDGCYDFTEVYGKRYEMRTATYTFEKTYASRALAVSGCRSFCQWLAGISGSLYDSVMDKSFVGARATSIEPSIEGGVSVVVSVEFTAQPKLSDGSI